MELGLLLVFWYGVLHAFGPDHLTAIADFSIGKSKRKTFLITLAFAIGHGVMLFVFAKILEVYHISDEILGYGDLISFLVILAMGIYLLGMVFLDRIQLKKHIHNGKEHIHIWFGKEHGHNNNDTTSAFTIGALMGIGGVRGMLITLGALEGQTVDFTMILSFALGVMTIFVGFGVVILYINKNLLNSKQNLKRVFGAAGLISILVGGNMLFAGDHHHINPVQMEYHSHKKDGFENMLDGKTKSDMTYNKLLHQSSFDIQNSLASGNWIDINENVHIMS